MTASLAALERELASYPSSSVTVRAITAMLAVLPDAAPLPAYTSIQTAAATVFGGVPDDIVARAKELAGDGRLDAAMLVARGIDTGDTGLTIVSGVRSALALFFGGASERSASVAQQQRADAALKALGIAFLITRLAPISPEKRVELVRSIPAGQELLLYYGAIEIALPFRAEVEAANGTFVRDLVRTQGRSMADKLLGLLGRQGVADAEGMLAHLTEELDRNALLAAPHAQAVAERIRSVLPSVATMAGDLFDLVAAGADALPCYRYLCGRLAVEASLALAKQERMPDIALPAPPSEAAPAPTPAPPPIPDLLRTVGTDPFAAPARRPDEAPPEAVLPSDPFAPPVPAHEPTDGLVPVEEAPVGPWPSEPLPEAQRLRGVFVDETGGSPAWWFFTVEGVVSDHPPDQAGPIDWDQHRAAGHSADRYTREGDTVHVGTGDRRATYTIVRGPYGLTIDERPWRRTDWDLTGRTLHGTWSDARGSITFGADGTWSDDDSSGTYALGVGVVVILSSGTSETRPLLTPLEPSSRAPAWLRIAGRHMRLKSG